MKVMITGGAGYIGSHTAVALHSAGHSVVILDNFSNSRESSIDALSGLGVDVKLHALDLGQLENPDYASIFDGIDAVIHMAGLKSVAESFTDPLRYYRQNVTNSMHLLARMKDAGVRDIVFSSSASVYGDCDHTRLNENSVLEPISPYGNTKLAVERLLGDMRPHIRPLSLRYFNPIGAHPSGELREAGLGRPDNLFPRIMDIAHQWHFQPGSGYLQIFGKDYDTWDGTCIRDYVHVMDIAEAHVKGVEYLKSRGADPYPIAMNLGTGRGTSVLQLVYGFMKTTGATVPLVYGPRRPGDPSCLVAHPKLAERELNWKATRTEADACRDGWRAYQRGKE